MKSDQSEIVNKPHPNEETQQEDLTSDNEKGIRRGDLIGATLLSILLATLAALALWLATPMRFGYLLTAAFIIAIFLIFKFLVNPRKSK
ncbi:hypothetical protein GRF61_13215 [Azoarcus sp. TTM-91]|uniref:hypothetical protein n=1 Tax=Azoarcus sp. TTM-91 TaxID=2691581 RepID=UPI00145CCD80|nr:hypothetical protein [Azoarcus sp. TTM-91]NMG35405.1 hypothetical protein [Azoarcus sp. TTM-91]